MAYLIGTDEAGYGPNLGPLVISATLWEVPEEAKDLLRPMYADIGKFRGDTERLPGYDEVDSDDLEAWKPVAIQGLRDVMTILQAKATPEEISAFKDWLMYVANTTAEASKEGALGLLGPRVSDKEKSALDEIRSTLDLGE